MRVILVGITMALLITAFFTGAWYTMIRDPEAASKVVEEEPIVKEEKIYEDGESFVEEDMDDNKLLTLQVTRLQEPPEDAELNELPANKEYAFFELFVENFEEYGKAFKGYYTKLKVQGEQVEPVDFVVVDKKGWNKFRLESEGHVKMILIYAIEKDVKEMDLIVSPEFYYKDLVYRFQNK
ncbi:hypothetical protein [Alkalihalobacillus sp. CinArs1]|uniref:hypothetical protein n=1 Tax=Alkalihalobacillus sp. CinArs1 TaxID=2995314 RepID=UPI0022DD6254|nr:hypothetical protein [Alkalihalobacillus sp. CinArs1]